MAGLIFSIPSDKAELLNVAIGNNYCVQNIVIPAEILSKLNEARTSLREEGPGFILENFDTYYSVLHHAEKLRTDLIHNAYKDLDKASSELKNALAFILEDKESLNEELKAKYINILKMLLYIHIQFVKYFEVLSITKRSSNLTTGGKNSKNKAKEYSFSIDKINVLNSINNIIQCEINLFWDPPVVEHDFINLLGEFCFTLLQNPAIKQEKELILNIFGVFGNLIKSYDFGNTFVTRLIQTIRMYEHAVQCVPNGIKMIIDQFNCKQIIHYLVKEATEWQIHETFQDNLGTRSCSIFLNELAVLAPDLMVPEVIYLNKYLQYDSQPLRTSILTVITEVILKILTKHGLSDEEKESRDELFQVLIEHMRDVSVAVRSKVIQNLIRLQKESAIPLDLQQEILQEAVMHLQDKGAVVRKFSIQYIMASLENNPFAASLQLKKIEEELTKKKELLETIGRTYIETQIARIQELGKDCSTIEEGIGMTEEDVKKVEALENVIKYLEKTAGFLRIIDTAVGIMKKLLFTTTTSDMHEAIKFFVVAYKFNIDNATSGILEILKLMQSDEQERKDAVIDAFKNVYLTTDGKDMDEHTTIIATRLFQLLHEITYEHIAQFEQIVTEWTVKGILDNSVIDKLWKYYVGQIKTNVDDARAAAHLLEMAALGRNTIITKNIGLVVKVAFEDEMKLEDMKFLAASCRLLAKACPDKIDIRSKIPPFKLKHTTPVFHKLTDILIENFFKKVPFYKDAMEAGFDFIFSVCSKPLDIAESVIKGISERLKEGNTDIYFYTIFCRMLGLVAIKVLSFLDNTAYRELKRRNFVRDSLKENDKKKSKKNRKSSAVNTTVSESTNANESFLMGAEATDTDAEFILNSLENHIVTNQGLIGQYAPFIVNICQRPDLYENVYLQEAAIVALMRFMLVSSVLCREHIKLVFIVLKKTPHAHIKCTILLHCSDLLTKFPNIVEPWSAKIYENLKDPLVKVRKTALFSLSNLILRDMILVHSRISEIAVCMIDPDEEVKRMCKTFFRNLADKDNNLVNIIPDIFMHLVKLDEIGEDDLRTILKFFFDSIDKNKRMENLVDRFCSNFTIGEDLRVNRNISFCLSLIHYNDKALRKLHEYFPSYKNHLHDAEIYATFKQILSECGKHKIGTTDLKPIITDIENCIASVFEFDENGQPAKPPPLIKKKSTKKTRAKLTNMKKKSKKKSSGSDTDNDDFEMETSRNNANGRSKKKINIPNNDDENTRDKKLKRGKKQRTISSSDEN